MLFNMHMLEMEVRLVLGQLHILGSVGYELVDPKEKDEEQMFYQQESSHPLHISPALSHRLSQVQGQEGTIGDDAEKSSDTKGEIPGANVPHGQHLWFPAQLVSVCHQLGQIVDKGKTGSQRIDG